MTSLVVQQSVDDIFLENDLDSLTSPSLRKDIYSVIKTIYEGGNINLIYDSHKFITPELKEDRSIFTLKDSNITGNILGEYKNNLLVLNTIGKTIITPVSISSIDTKTQDVKNYPLHLESMSVLKYTINQEHMFLYSNRNIHIIDISLLLQNSPHLRTISIKSGYLKIYPEFKSPIVSRTVEDLTEFYILDKSSTDSLKNTLSLPVSLVGLTTINNSIMGCTSNKLYIIDPNSFSQTNVSTKYIIHNFGFLLTDELTIKESSAKINTSIELHAVNDEYVMISMQRKILLYNLETHRIDRIFDGHKNDDPTHIINIAGSIGKYIITIGSDKTIRVWDFSTYLGCVQILSIDDNIDHLCIINETKIYLHGSIRNYTLNVEESSLSPREYTNEWDWIFTDPTMRVDFLVENSSDVQSTILNEVKNVIRTYYTGGTISKSFESHSKDSEKYINSILRKSFSINVQPLHFSGQLVGYSDGKLIIFKENKFKIANFSPVWDNRPFKYTITPTRKIVNPIKFASGKNYFICKDMSSIIDLSNPGLNTSIINIFSLKRLFANEDPYVKSIDLTDIINNIIWIKDDMFALITKTKLIIIRINNEVSIDVERYNLIIDQPSSVVIANNRLLYIKNNRIHIYDLSTKEELKLDYSRENLVVNRLGTNYICVSKQTIEIRSSNFELIRIIPNLQDIITSIIPIDDHQFISEDIKGNYLVTDLNAKTPIFKEPTITTILNEEKAIKPFIIGDTKIHKISGPVSISLYTNISTKNPSTLIPDVKIILCGDEHGSNSGMCLKERGTYNIDDVMRIWSYSGISGDVYLENWRMLYEDNIYHLSSNTPIERTNQFATIHNRLPLGNVKFHSSDVRYLPNVENVLLDSWAIVQYLRSLRSIKINRNIDLNEEIPKFLNPLSDTFDSKSVVENVVARMNLYMYSDNFITDTMPYLSKTRKVDIIEYTETTKIVKRASIKDISDEEKENLLKTGTSLVGGKRVHKIRKQFLLCSKEMQIPLEKYYIYRLEQIKDKFNNYFKSNKNEKQSIINDKSYLNILVNMNLILTDMYLLCRLFKNIHLYKSKNIMIYVGDIHANYYREFFDNFLQSERLDSTSDAYRCQNVSQFNMRFI